MNGPTSLVSLLAGAMLLFSAESSAAEINWGAATNITGDSDVSTLGTLVGALNLGNSNGVLTTVNGVAFTGFQLTASPTPVTDPSGTFSFSGDNMASGSVSTGAAPFSNLSAEYQSLLGTTAGNNGNPLNPNPLTLSITVTPGSTYVYQSWYNLSAVNFSIYSTLTTGGTDVTLNSNTTGVPGPGAAGGLGQYVVGTFLADGTSQDITLTSTVSAGMNAVQLRDITPATAYWLGDVDGSWSTSSGGNTNWATAQDGLTDTQAVPGSTSDVIFSADGAANQTTTLDSDFTVKSVTVNDATAVTITGANTLTLSSDNAITVNSGAGLFTISTDGLALSGSAPTVMVDNLAGAVISSALEAGTTASLTKTGSGKLTLTGINTYTGDTDVNDGTLEISGAGQITATRDLTIGNLAGKTPTMIVDGVGSSVNVTRYLTVGNDGGFEAGGILNITNGATVKVADETTLGYYAGAAVTVDGAGSKLTLSASSTNYLGYYAGYYSDNVTTNLTVSNGGTLDFGYELDTGYESYGTANTTTLTVDGAGSTATGGTLLVGYYSTADATLDVINGGTLTTDTFRLGYYGYGLSTANVTGAGSTLTVNSEFTIGYSYLDGTQVLNILDGGKVDVTGTIDAILGDNSDSGGTTSATANVDGTGSLWNVGGTLRIATGGGDNDTLNLKNGGVVNVGTGTGTVELAAVAGGTATLNIGALAGTDTAGTLEAAEVHGGAGTAVVNFNQTGATDFDAKITGSTSVNQKGTGTSVLTAASTYTGTTSVEAGSLVVTGSLSGAGAITVDIPGTLAGSGAITTAVDQSIFINGILSVGDPTVLPAAATLSLTTSGTGGIVMGAGSVILVDLFTGAGAGNNTGIGASADVLSVQGQLNATGGGTLVIGNPNLMTAFANGDQWKLVDLNGGTGTIVGTLAVNDSALGLTNGVIGSFDPTTGIYSIIDLKQLSATTTGLPIANAESQMIIMASSTVTNDVNGHLFSLIAGEGEEAANESISAAMDYGVIEGQGDGPESPMTQSVRSSRQWKVFTTVNYGNVRLNSIGAQAGVQIDAWAPSIGFERHLSQNVTLGFAATFLTSDQVYTAGLGSLHLEGPALSAYFTYVKKNFWSSLLYNFGTYELDSRRNPGFGFAQAFGTTRTYTNSLQFNTGWNFRSQDNTFVTGPFAGIDYLHGSVDGYSETGGGLAALAYGRQSFDSLVTRVGWAASKKIQTDWALITPQLRVSYERQNVKNNGTSVSLINAPFTATGGNQTPGQDYMVLAAGVNFAFSEQWSLLLGYQTQIFRNNMAAHFGSVRLGFKF